MIVVVRASVFLCHAPFFNTFARCALLVYNMDSRRLFDVRDDYFDIGFHLGGADFGGYFDGFCCNDVADCCCMDAWHLKRERFPAVVVRFAYIIRAPLSLT